MGGGGGVMGGWRVPNMAVSALDSDMCRVLFIILNSELLTIRNSNKYRLGEAVTHKINIVHFTHAR